MADYAFAAATSWAELRAIHARWFADYNDQDHWPHRQRTDGYHSPPEVLGWVHGIYRTEEQIERVFRLRSGAWSITTAMCAIGTGARTPSADWSASPPSSGSVARP